VEEEIGKCQRGLGRENVFEGICREEDCLSNVARLCITQSYATDHGIRDLKTVSAQSRCVRVDCVASNVRIVGRGKVKQMRILVDHHLAVRSNLTGYLD